jgi:hypothetical protein
MQGPLRIFTKLAETYGDLVHFTFGGTEAYLVTNPEFIKEILVTRHQNFIKSKSLLGLRLSPFLSSRLPISSFWRA